VWASPIDIWNDTVAKSPNKLRPRFQLAKANADAGHYPEAIENYEKAAQLEVPNFDLLVDWGLAYDGLGKPAEAIAKLRQAAALERNAHVYSQIGMVYGKMGQYAQALDALAVSIQLDPDFMGGMAYIYRGDVFMAQGHKSQAAEEYRHALAISSANSIAREKLARLGL
jgi:tetratricopeptide (TPR) repeat protein